MLIASSCIHLNPSLDVEFPLNIHSFQMYNPQLKEDPIRIFEISLFIPFNEQLLVRIKMILFKLKTSIIQLQLTLD